MVSLLTVQGVALAGEAGRGPEFAAFQRPPTARPPLRLVVQPPVLPADGFGPLVPRAPEQAALQAAARGDWPQVMTALRTAGLRPAVQDDEQATLLTRAAQAGAEEVVAELLRQGADVQQRGHRGWPPLAWAVMEGQLAVVRQLARAGADLLQPNGAPQPPLHWAAQLNRLGVVQGLLDLGVPLMQRNPAGETAAQRALQSGADETGAWLLPRVDAEVDRLQGIRR